MNDNLLNDILADFKDQTGTDNSAQAPLETELRKAQSLSVGDSLVSGTKVMFSALFGKTASGRDHELVQYTATDWPEELHKYIPKADPHYKFRPEETERFLVGMRGDRRASLLWGAAGTGKSSMPMQIAALLNMPLLRVNMSEDADGSRLLGSPTVEAGDLGWNPGDVQIAAKHGCWIMIDEFDSASAGINENCKPFLERGGNINVPECSDATLRFIEPSDTFKVILTANTNLMGDETGSYANSRVQPIATLDRMSSVIKFDYNSPAAEREILNARFPELENSKAVNQLVQFGSLVRSAYKQGQVRYPASSRTLMDIAEEYLFFGSLSAAIDRALLDKVPESESSIYNDLKQQALV